MSKPKKIAFMFPGQGAQYVGMIKRIYDSYPQVRAIFEAVDDKLKVNLTRLINCGPEVTMEQKWYSYLFPKQEELRATENAQPAILATSIANRLLLKDIHGVKMDPMQIILLPHSLGEYSALVAAHPISLLESLVLVRRL